MATTNRPNRGDIIVPVERDDFDRCLPGDVASNGFDDGDEPSRSRIVVG